MIRGPHRSRAIESCVEEAKFLAEEGVQEIIVVAQDITRYGIDLYGKRSLAERIVDKAIEFKLGARGLRSIVESIMMEAMFDIPTRGDKQFEVTLDYARKQMEKSNLSRLQAGE